MTWQQLFEIGKKELESASIGDAPFDAWYLLEHVSGMDRAKYFLQQNELVSEECKERYFDLVEKRKAHIPLQHITGKQDFMGLTFGVNEHVLIPRQDTEVLVEAVLSSLVPNAHVLDMCTGSGCILVSIMKYGSEVSGTGVDISGEALMVAQRNAEQHQVNAKFLQSDLFTNVEGKYDVIVSNPPYIRTSVIEELEEEVKLHDPFIALDGKEDGLYFYRRIVDECRGFLKSGGRLYFEIGHDQGQEVKELMEQQGFAGVTVKKDLAGLDRVVFGVYNV